MKKYLVLIFASLLFYSCQKDIQPPVQKNNFEKLTSYEEVAEYIERVSNYSDNIETEKAAVSSEGRDIKALKISESVFGRDTSKIKVFVFAQQHGDEPSGKEGILLLLKDIASGNLDKLLDKIDLILIPQVNPDGGEKNKRRNAYGADLNRDHLVLSQNETIGLHKLFNKYLPEVSLDVHEYYPYGKSWREFGYLKNFDEQFGTLTNINVDKEILRLEKNFIPYIDEYLGKKGFTFHEYVLGGPPNKKRMRFSTVDINDGRQSLGILNTFSFILEGKSAREIEGNLKHRSMGQYYAVKGFLEYVYQNKQAIKKTVRKGRNELKEMNPNEKAIIRMEHVPGNEPVKLNLRSTFSGEDTLMTIENFHTEVKALLEVNIPKAYLIPKTDSLLVNLLNKHNIEYSENKESSAAAYLIEKIKKSVDEELENKYPELSKEKIGIKNPSNYFYVPLNQLHKNMLVTAFEPQSMLGIVQYEEFEYLLKEGERYPVFRVE